MNDFEDERAIDDLLSTAEEISPAQVSLLFDHLSTIVNETERKDFISKLFDVLPMMND